MRRAWTEKERGIEGERCRENEQQRRREGRFWKNGELGWKSERD